MHPWQKIETAPQIEGQRILAWVDAAESPSGIIEMVWCEIYDEGYWTPVVEHPWTNACIDPLYWAPTLPDPTAPYAGDPICRGCATQEPGSPPLSPVCICGNPA